MVGLRKLVFETIEFMDQEVFSGDSPTGWTDLDLSSWIGALRALVYIKCHAVETTSDLRFRENGETEEIGYISGVSMCTLVAGESAYLWVLTDENGVVEWIATYAASCVLTLKAYLPAPVADGERLSKTPDYDSGWLTYDDLEIKVLTHDLGTTKVLAMVQGDYSGYGIMLTDAFSQVHVHNMTTTQVSVESWMPNGDKIRLMLWKLA